MRLWNRILLAAFLLLPVYSASAEIRVVTTLHVLADIAKQVGGGHVSVRALSKSTESPHYVIPRPSLMAAVSEADLFVEVGMQLEIWTDPVLEGAGNSNVRPGRPGHVYASEGVRALEVPVRLTRAEGDIHPSGNPHVWLGPNNAAKIAENIAKGLIRVDPVHAADYEANLSTFVRQLDERMEIWKSRAKPLRGLKFVSYHKQLVYLADFLGIEEANTIEEKPGIPPSAAHHDRLMGQMKKEGIRLIIQATFDPLKISERFARDANARIVRIPIDVHGTPEASDYLKMIDAILSELLTAVEAKG